MLRNKNRLLTREQIIDHVWNYDFDSYSNIVDVYIRYLRKKLDTGYDKKLITTVRGSGYMLKDE
jgi:DNA-binding response OmpR family regulator